MGGTPSLISEQTALFERCAVHGSEGMFPALTGHAHLTQPAALRPELRFLPHSRPPPRPPVQDAVVSLKSARAFIAR